MQISERASASNTDPHNRTRLGSPSLPACGEKMMAQNSIETMNKVHGIHRRAISRQAVVVKENTKLATNAATTSSSVGSQ